MFDKNFLLDKVVNSLERLGYEVLPTSGCFDIVAKRDRLLLVKVLSNVDAFSEEHAMSLRSISYFLSAYPVVVSTRNNRETLEDGVVYSRFDVPVVTPKFLDEMLVDEDTSAVMSSKGRHTVEIDADALRQRRKELDFTLDSLAEVAGISKKALYEIENRRVNPSEDTVSKLEKILRAEFKIPYRMKTSEATYVAPTDNFQQKVSREFRRIGIDNSSVRSAPFEIVGKENFSVITTLTQNVSKLKREANFVKKLSSAFSSKAVFVAKKSEHSSVEGVPVVLESELPEIGDTKELKEIIDEKE